MPKLLFAVALAMLLALPQAPPTLPAQFISYQVDTRRNTLRLYWQDEYGRRFGSLGRLRAGLAAHGQCLDFAMNGGMFAPGSAPQGLFIENGKT